jgi:hypothetical protein
MPLPHYHYAATEEEEDEEVDEEVEYLDPLTVMYCSGCRIPRSADYLLCPYCHPPEPTADTENQPNHRTYTMTTHRVAPLGTRPSFLQPIPSRALPRSVASPSTPEKKNALSTPEKRKSPSKPEKKNSLSKPENKKSRSKPTGRYHTMGDAERAAILQRGKDRYHALSKEEKAALLHKRKVRYHALKEKKMAALQQKGSDKCDGSNAHSRLRPYI